MATLTITKGPSERYSEGNNGIIVLSRSLFTFRLLCQDFLGSLLLTASPYVFCLLYVLSLSVLFFSVYLFIAGAEEAESKNFNMLFPTMYRVRKSILRGLFVQAVARIFTLLLHLFELLCRWCSLFVAAGAMQEALATAPSVSCLFLSLGRECLWRPTSASWNPRQCSFPWCSLSLGSCYFPFSFTYWLHSFIIPVCSLLKTFCSSSCCSDSKTK